MIEVVKGLNKAGVAHVAAELKRLGLEHWDVDATVADIEMKNGFMEMSDGCSYDYEISMNDVRRHSYGPYATIEIVEKDHVTKEFID